MTEKEYYNKQRVSSSSLKWFEISPLFYKKMLNKEIEQESKRYFEIGKKIHMKILEPNEFDKNYIFLDYETPKSENQRQFCEDYITAKGNKDYKLSYAYRKNYKVDKSSEEDILEKATSLKTSLSKYITYLKKRSEVKDVLTYTDNKLINECDKLAHEHIAATNLLYITDPFLDYKEYNELVILFVYNNVECKSMIDRLVIDHTNKVVKLIDLKTTSNLSEFKHSFEEFNYYRQMTFYWIAIHSYCKDNNIDISDYTKETYIISFQKGDLPECRVFQIQEAHLNRGLEEIDSILFNIKWHQDNNQWEHTKDYYDNNGIEQL